MTICNSRIVRIISPIAAVLFLALLLCETPFPQEKSKEPAWHSIDAWRQPQGLPQNSVLAILQTQDGYLWVGTKGGVARFDGVRFTTFDNRNMQQLRENEVWALAEGDDSSLWIGTYGGGVSRLKDGQFTVYTTKDGLVNDFVSSLCKDGEGGVWIGTDGGVSRYKDGLFTNYTVTDGLVYNAVKSLYPDRDGSVWVGTSKGGLHRFKSGKNSRQVIEGLSAEAEVRSIFRDRGQSLWVATTAGLFRLQAGNVTKYATHEGLLSDRVNSVHEDVQGTLWIGTDRGLNKYRDGAISASQIRDDDASADSILAICSDREGSIWIGFRNQGLGRLRRGQFISFTTKDGLADDYVSTVLQDKYRPIWIGTNKGLNLFRGGEFTTYIVGDDSFSHRIMALAEIKQRPGLADTPIIMLTSAGQGSGDESRSQMGIAACLTKPVKQSELLRTILTTLGAPLDQPSLAATRPARAAQQAPTEKSGSLHILLAEDNVVNQRLVIRLLEKQGHAITVANNGREAVAALSLEHFDIVLMDMQMPEMDGFEATARIREQEQLTGVHIPVIAMTAHAMQGDRERCLEAGMDAYVSKPIQAAELFKLIMNLASPAKTIGGAFAIGLTASGIEAISGY